MLNDAKQRVGYPCIPHEHPWSIPCSREKMMKKLCSYNFMQLLVAMIEIWYKIQHWF